MPPSARCLADRPGGHAAGTPRTSAPNNRPRAWRAAPCGGRAVLVARPRAWASARSPGSQAPPRSPRPSSAGMLRLLAVPSSLAAPRS
eukprot:scaffold14344_cov69-Phaeocystis_antarctica.AAC.7